MWPGIAGVPHRVIWNTWVPLLYPLPLLVSVPDVRRELPLVSDLLPYDNVFPDYLLALLAFGHQGEGSDLPGGVAAERLYIYRRQLEIATASPAFVQNA